MELREKIAAAILEAMDVTDGLDATAAEQYADAILAIPEIAEALAHCHQEWKRTEQGQWYRVRPTPNA